MGWHDRMNKAIEYIETNLAGKIDMDKAAHFINQSVTGFQRTLWKHMMETVVCRS